VGPWTSNGKFQSIFGCMGLTIWDLLNGFLINKHCHADLGDFLIKFLHALGLQLVLGDVLIKFLHALGLQLVLGDVLIKFLHAFGGPQGVKTTRCTKEWTNKGSGGSHVGVRELSHKPKMSLFYKKIQWNNWKYHYFSNFLFQACGVWS
jgi:hypothetical protein